MTLSPFIIYLWGITDAIGHVFEFLAVGSVILMTVFGIITIAAHADKCEEIAKLFRWPLFCSVIAALIFVPIQSLIPSSKTVALMVVVPAILNSEPIQKDLPEIYRMAKDALKQILTPTK